MTAKPALQPEATLPRLATLPQSEGQWLKQLIDESFIHLSSAQREELFASLTRMLNDPRYVQSRSLILAEFTGQAIALRDAHRRLAGLTPDQMRAIAVEARQEYERLPVSQREQMLQVLQHGIPGMPRTLNDMMLAEFGNAPFSKFKEALVELAATRLTPIGEEMRRLMADPVEIDRILAEGATRAHGIADPILAKTKDIVGFIHS
jgi:hypothetical protein